MNKKKTIFSTAAHYHDSVAALLIDGHLIAALQEERFTRKTHDPAIPLKAVQACLEQAGITID